MGMFDTFEVNYPLPLPKRLVGIVDPHDLDYQTKDLFRSFSHYTVSKRGLIYVQNFNDSKPKQKRFYYSGHINIYDFVSFDDKPFDLWLEYRLFVSKGRVVKAKLISAEQRDNQERLTHEAEWEAKSQKHHELWNKWYMKYGYKYYDSFIHWVFVWYRRLSQKLPASYRVESWFRPL